jgi:hypothetical protein
MSARISSRRRVKSQFHMLRVQFGLRDRAVAAEYFGVSERTITNWDRDGAPDLAMKLLMCRTRSLSALHPDWHGFTIGANGKLYGPNRLQLSAEHLRHHAEASREVEYLRAEVSRLRAQLDSRADVVRSALASSAPGLIEALRGVLP